MAQITDDQRSFAASTFPALAVYFDAIADAINDLADGSISTTAVTATTVATTGDLTVGDDINFEGATGTHDIVLADNKADALSVSISGGNDLLVFHTQNASAGIDREGVTAPQKFRVGEVWGFTDVVSALIVGQTLTAPASTPVYGVYIASALSGSGTVDFCHMELDGHSIAITGGAANIVTTLYLDEPNITLSGGASIPVACTFYIEQAPTEGTENHAIWVDAGSSRFDGGIRGPTVASARCWHTGGNPAMLSTDGTNLTVVATELYVAEVFIPANATVTGVAVFWGDATEGNAKVMLFDSAGTRVAISASTDVSGFTADSYGTRIPFSAAYSAVGPGTYYVGVIADNTGNRINTHTLGNFGAGKITGLVYGTEAGYATITPPTTFTTGLGPIATLY